MKKKNKLGERETKMITYYKRRKKKILQNFTQGRCYF